MKFTRFWLIIFIALIFSGTLFIAADICFADDSGFSDIKFTGTDAVIIRYKGNVKIQKKNDNDWMIPAVGMKLKGGTKIKTGKTASYIELMLNYAEESAKKNVVRIECASSIELTKISPNNTQILLDKGELSCILQKTSKGTHFEIKTPVAICGAKGTGWKVTHNPRTIAYCFESKIFMQPLDDQGRPTGDRVNINEGHKKTMGAGGFIGPTKRIGSWQKRRWNSWMRDLGEFCNKNLSRPSGKTADPYTAPPESTGGNLNKDASDMGQNSDSKSKDARDNKKNEQNVQGSALRGDTDKDSDGDGVLDKDDLYPTDPKRASGNDLDGDGIDDEFDSDTDGDGYTDTRDEFPRDKNEWADNDNDGIGDNADPDDDNDGMPDIWEETNGTNPKVNDADKDPDNDGLSNKDEMANDTNPFEDDTDDDGLKDGDEVAGNTPNRYETDPAKADTDNDDEIDSLDRFPLDAKEQADSDDDAGTYWNLVTGQLPGANLFMPKDADNKDNLYPGDNEDAFNNDGDIDGQEIYRDAAGNLTYAVNGDAVAYGLIVTNIEGDQEVVRGYGSRWEMQSELSEMIQESKEIFADKADLRNDVNQFRADIAARQKDARLTKAADARMHKVMTDNDGNRVRVEQYVLRPVADDNSIIQLLNVNLRTAGYFAGLTTLNWTMKFNRDIAGEKIKDLPWDDYLTIIETRDGYGITSKDQLYCEVKVNDAYLPETMMIQLAHNNNAITEMTTFEARQKIASNYEQNIGTYNLTLQTPDGANEIFNNYADFKDATISAAGSAAEFVSVLDCKIELSGWSGGPRRWTRTETRTPAQVFAGSFIVINNDGTGTDEVITVAGLSDMLRVGYFDLDNGSNLESLFSYLDMNGSGYSQRRVITARGPNPDNPGLISYGEWTQHGSLSENSLFSSKGINCILVPVNDESWESDFNWWGE